MRFSTDFIEQVREANNIVDIIGQYTDLKARGHQHTGLCPFPDHNEKSPSFSVSENKQLYHCFGCKKSGNIFTFLEQFSGMTFTDSVEYLARRAGIPVPEDDKSEGDGKLRTTLYRINRYAASHFHRQLKDLPESHAVKKYLKERGMSEEIIDELKIGYAADSWDNLLKFFNSKKVPQKDAANLGLIKARKSGKGYFDMFRHRLIFPILSPQDDVLGFGGRVLKKEDKPKYLNSPESKVFSKGRTFYGLNLTGKHIRQENCAIVVEGYMDFIALYSVGIKNVVATLGTAMTADHVKLLKRYTPRVLLMFDGDYAGQQAAERSLEIAFTQGLCPLAVFLPESLDPDDYIKKYGADSLKEKITNAEELFIQLLSRWLKDFKYTAIEKLEFMARVKPLLESISEPSLKSLYVKEVAERLNVEEVWVREQLTKKQKTTVESPEASPEVFDVANPPKVCLQGTPKDELYLLGISVNYLELLEKIIDSGVVEQFSNENAQTLLARVIDKYRQKPSDFDKLAALVVSMVEVPEELTGLFNFWSRNGDEDEVKRATEKCINRVKERFLKRQSAIIASQLRNGVSPEKLEQIMNIQKDRIQLHRNESDKSAKGDA